MTDQRVSLDELRSSIEQFHRASRATGPVDEKWGIVILTAQCAAWQTAYRWHLGITQELLADNYARACGDTDALSERDQGELLIRERLR